MQILAGKQVVGPVPGPVPRAEATYWLMDGSFKTLFIFPIGANGGGDAGAGGGGLASPPLLMTLMLMYRGPGHSRGGVLLMVAVVMTVVLGLTDRYEDYSNAAADSCTGSNAVVNGGDGERYCKVQKTLVLVLLLQVMMNTVMIMLLQMMVVVVMTGIQQTMVAFVMIVILMLIVDMVMILFLQLMLALLVLTTMVMLIVEMVMIVMMLLLLMMMAVLSVTATTHHPQHFLQFYFRINSFPYLFLSPVQSPILLITTTSSRHAILIFSIITYTIKSRQFSLSGLTSVQPLQPCEASQLLPIP